MNRVNVTAVASAGSGVLLGLLLAFQAGAQGQSGGARPSGATGSTGNAGALGWPRGPEVQTPSRLPQDKTFGKKGSAASTDKAANASSAAAAKAKSAAEAECAKAKAAIAAAGTGGTTGEGQGGAAGAEGRAKAAEAVCSGVPADAGQSNKAPGQTGVTGTGQATLRANDHAEDGLEKAQGNEESDDASDVRKTPEQKPPK
jgi:hypothetical protein